MYVCVGNIECCPPTSSICMICLNKEGGEEGSVVVLSSGIHPKHISDTFLHPPYLFNTAFFFFVLFAPDSHQHRVRHLTILFTCDLQPPPHTHIYKRYQQPKTMMTVINLHTHKWVVAFLRREIIYIHTFAPRASSCCSFRRRR